MIVAVSLTMHYFRTWEAGESNIPLPVSAGIRPSRKGVIVTIAREHGSCGKRIGQLVAEQIGVACYYKEMTALAAQESGFGSKVYIGYQ